MNNSLLYLCLLPTAPAGGGSKGPANDTDRARRADESSRKAEEKADEAEERMDRK